LYKRRNKIKYVQASGNSIRRGREEKKLLKNYINDNPIFELRRVYYQFFASLPFSNIQFYSKRACR
jgi:hypothetical protein